jgi:hypothetical protein
MRVVESIRGLTAICAFAAIAACGSSSGSTLAPPDFDATSPDDGATASDGGGSDASPIVDGAGTDSTLSDGSPDDGSRSNEAASPDAGAADAEAGIAEAGESDAEAGSPGGDGGTGPTLVQSGTTLSLQGITNDGQVVYYDSSSQSYYAKSVHGGSATLIYAVPATSYYTYTRVLANSVFVLDVNANFVALVTLWSSAMAQPMTLTTAGLSTYYSSLWASDDGQHIAYLQVSSDGSVGGIYGANADGSNPTLLVGNIVANNAPGRCFPLLTFRGGYAVASYCAVTDAGTQPHLIGAFSIADGWAPALQVPNAIFTRTPFATPTNPFYFPYAVDPDGGVVVAASTSSAGGALQAFAIDGGGATVLDPNVPITPASSLAGIPTAPWYALYNTDAGALRQVYPSNPAPKTLVPSGVTLFDNVSPDGKWMLVSSGENSRGLLDISAVSTDTPGSPQLVATPAQYGNLGITVITLPGAAFTADSQYALVLTNLAQDSFGGTIFYARSLGVYAPYIGRMLSKGYATDLRPLTGSKVLVTDNFQDTDGGTGSLPLVDFDVVDPSSDAPGTRIATVDAETNYAISADHTFVIYTVVSGPAPGLYAVAIP